MSKTRTRSLAAQLKRVPLAVRPTVEAARKMVQAVAPHAAEVAYQSQPPRSRSALWKLARYTLDGMNVVGIGAFPTYALLFFYQGRDLEDRTDLLEGGGKAMRFLRLDSPGDARRLEVRRIVRNAFRRAVPAP